MVSTGWRTACTIIVIVVGAALLTFAVFIWHRQRMLRRISPRSEMQQRAMASYAFDTEAHRPLLHSETMPPLPFKTHPTSRQSVPAGDVDEWGFKLRTPVVRVPVPSMYVPEADREIKEESAPPTDGPAPVSMPEPTAGFRFFPTPTFLQFPKIQFTRNDERLGRLPSLRIQFLRESNQIISSPVSNRFPDVDRRSSASSRPSTRNRPFATMAVSPLPPLVPLPPAKNSPTSTVSRSDSVASVGHHLFARKSSGEDGSDTILSRGSSQRGRVSPLATLRRGNGSANSSAASGKSDANSGSRVDTAWAPDVMASYSPWKGVVHASWVSPSQVPAQGVHSPVVESPTGQLRAMEAWRPMPTLLESTDNVATMATVSLPRPLPEPPAASTSPRSPSELSVPSRPPPSSPPAP
ncbi:hypothetical protein C2E23DRAFT_258270 [Lenzites betulinus]|nr:hypothetical protein C2E23DRAFT_258270 [Lenzites betulinus]